MKGKRRDRRIDKENDGRDLLFTYKFIIIIIILARVQISYVKQD